MWQVLYVGIAKKVVKDNFHPPIKRKGKTILPAKIKDAISFLANELEVDGPVRSAWPHYSQLGRNTYHCHLDKSKKWVACWEQIKLSPAEKELFDGYITIIYIGTHENAPY